MLPSPTFPLHPGLGRVSHQVRLPPALISYQPHFGQCLIQLAYSFFFPTDECFLALPTHCTPGFGRESVAIARFGCRRNYSDVHSVLFPRAVRNLVGAGRACCNSLVWVRFGRPGHLLFEVFVIAGSWLSFGRVPNSGLAPFRLVLLPSRLARVGGHYRFSAGLCSLRSRARLTQPPPHSCNLSVWS